MPSAAAQMDYIHGCNGSPARRVAQSITNTLVNTFRAVNSCPSRSVRRAAVTINPMSIWFRKLCVRT